MGSRSNVRIPCPAMGSSSSPPGGPPKKTPGNKIFACLCPCSVFEYIDSEDLKKKPGGLGKIEGLRRGMVPTDDALLKKPLRIVMEEVDCSKLDFSQCPKCPPIPKDCSPPKASRHITAAPCVTQNKQNPAGALKTTKLCPLCPPQKGPNNHPKPVLQRESSPSRPANCLPCPEPLSKKKSPQKNHTGLDGVTNSVLEMTLDQTGNLINQCAPKGSPTILKVEKLDEAGAAETVIKITFCSGKSQPVHNETAATPGKKKCSSHSPLVSTPFNQQTVKQIGAPGQPTPQSHPAPASTPNSPIRGKSPLKEQSPPRAQQPQKASVSTESGSSEGSHESDDRRRATTRSASNRSEEEHEDEEEEEEEEEYEEEGRSPDRRVVNIALVEPSKPKPPTESLLNDDQKNETPTLQPPSREKSSLVYQPQPPNEFRNPLPLPRPIWLPPSMVRSPSPPCHDRDTSQLTYSGPPNKDEVTFESKPQRGCKEEQSFTDATYDKQVVVKTREVDEQKTEVCFLKPTRKRSWRSTALSKTIRGTKDVSMAITYTPFNEPSNDDPADSLRPLISMQSAEALIRQLESLPLPSKTWGLRADQFEATATSSSTDLSKVSASSRLNKLNPQKVKSPTRAVLHRSPPIESSVLVKKNAFSQKAKPKGPMQFFIRQSTDASSVTSTALKKRNMRVICASSIKREIRPSSAKKIFKETAV